MVLEYLKALARRLMARPSSEWPPFLPDGPSEGVREPRPRQPGGRGPAVAVAEPDDDRDPFVTALGRTVQRR